MSTMETEKGVEERQTATPTISKSDCRCTLVDVALRSLLLAASIVAVVVMVTSKQTEMIPVPGVPGLTVPHPAKFSDSPAFIYFVVALSTTGLYSIITLIVSVSLMAKPNFPAKIFLILAAHDVLMLGVVAAATGTAGAVGYIGLNGNTHMNWGEVCNVYDKLCRYIGASIFVSLVAAVVLVVLVILNACALYKRIPGTNSLFF